jgi:hypothetical protein
MLSQNVPQVQLVPALQPLTSLLAQVYAPLHPLLPPHCELQEQLLPPPQPQPRVLSALLEKGTYPY